MRKNADIFSPDQKIYMFGSTLLPASLVAGALANWNVKRRTFDNVPTTEKAVRKLARKHLGDNIEVRAVEGLGNAFHTTERDESGATKHIITYDPRATMSVIAHEIGHGLKPVPRVPLAGFLAPALMSSGLFNIGRSAGLDKPIRPRDVALAGIGAAAYAPTLAGEYLATQQAKEVLGKDTEGLGAAYLTYALPPLLAAGYGLGAYGIGRVSRGKSLIPDFMKISDAYLAGFFEKCAMAGYDANSLLAQMPSIRQTPNPDVAPPQPVPEQEGTFGVPGTPLQNRAADAEARDTLAKATPKVNLGTNVFSQMKSTVSGDGGVKVSQAQAPMAAAQPNPNAAAGAPSAPAAGGAAPKRPMQPTPHGSLAAQAVQSLQNQTKAIPGAASLGATPAGKAVQKGSGILSAFNPQKAQI